MKLLENIFFSSSPHKLEKWLVLIVFFSIWIGVFYITGILQAGFHLTDDHEIILFNDLLKKQSVFSLISEQVYTDMLTRFRPLYYPHRILMTYVLGVNASAWAIYFCFLGVISSFFLYHALRKIGFSFFEALLFPLFAFFGEQTAVWWRLGTAETLGMLFASLSILLATVSHQNRLYSFIFIVSTLLASLSKESFILLIPALIFWKIWVEKSLSINKIDWKVAIKLNLISIIVLIICVLAEIYVISIQTNAQSTIFNATDANSDSAFRNTILLYMINKILTFNQIHILLIVFVAILLFAISDEFPKAKNRLTHVFQELIPIFLFVLLILMPQFVLYSRTDLYERYLIPAT
nr:hypothetical protein [Thermoflexibacter sp.]